MLVDYHLHSSFSFDGTQTLEQLCEAALERGLDEIAITEHLDICSGSSYRKALDCREYFAALADIRKRYDCRLKIRSGVELGQPMRNPEEAAAFLRDWQPDFVIGSIHNMTDDVDVGTYDYHELDFFSWFPEYLRCLYDLAANYDYDVLGHVTYPMRYLYLQTGKQPDPMLWEDMFTDIFSVTIARGKGIELNTSSLARGSGPLMPSLPLLKLYRKLGGTIITTGSDAHIAAQTGTTARKAAALLLEAGFSHITTYINRIPRNILL